MGIHAWRVDGSNTIIGKDQGGNEKSPRESLPPYLLLYIFFFNNTEREPPGEALAGAASGVGDVGARLYVGAVGTLEPHAWVFTHSYLSDKGSEASLLG